MVKLGHGEFTGRVVGIGEAYLFARLINGGDVVVARIVKQGDVSYGACRDDLGDFSFDDLAGLRLCCLLCNSDSFACFDEFGDIALGCVVRHTTHRDVIAFCQSDVQNAGRGLGIIKKHLIEVT